MSFIPIPFPSYRCYDDPSTLYLEGETTPLYHLNEWNPIAFGASRAVLIGSVNALSVLGPGGSTPVIGAGDFGNV
jgi:hypothetical protein